MEQKDDFSTRIKLFASFRTLATLKDTEWQNRQIYVKGFAEYIVGSDKYTLLGQTELVADNVNPDFQHQFVVDYLFEKSVGLKFEVFIKSDDKKVPDKLIGSSTDLLSQIVNQNGQTVVFDLKDENKQMIKIAKLVLRAEKVEQTLEKLELTWKVDNLKGKSCLLNYLSCWGKVSPFMKMMRTRGQNRYVEVKRSQTVNDSQNPSWQSMSVWSSQLFTGQKQSFRVQVWNADKSGEQLLAHAIIDSKELKSGASFKLQNSGSKDLGTLTLESVKRLQLDSPSFFDYIRGGLKLDVMTAIDFTGSNGPPAFPGSLHFRDKRSKNEYEKVLDDIDRIMSIKDSQISCYGFGAKPKFQGTIEPISHCFPLSGYPKDTTVKHFEELRDKYHHCIQNVELAGPTFFGPIIEEAMRKAEIIKKEGSNKYQLLLVVTDGELHDMEHCKDLIVKACQLPLSILIIGLGNAEFDSMRILDGDSGLTSQSGQKAPRDIVQFVVSRDFGHSGLTMTRNLFSQVPGQVVDYMSLIAKAPSKLSAFDFQALVAEKLQAGQVK